jgi:hypothetical protein
LARVLVLATIAMSKSPASARLRSFDALAVVDQDINFTTVGGRFSPTTSIDLTSQVVILSVAGAAGFRSALSVGSFRKTWLDGNVANATGGLYRTEILLQPLGGGNWAYSASIEGFIPGSTSVTISLTIGSQVGKATVEAYVLPKREP